MEVGQGIYHRLTLFWAGHLMHGPKGLLLHLRVVVVQHRQSAKGFGWLETWNLGAEKLLEEVKSEESPWEWDPLAVPNINGIYYTFGIQGFLIY